MTLKGSEMKIEDREYRGIKYTVELATGDGWRNELHKFYANGGMFSSGYYATFDGAVKDIEMKIDKSLDACPKDVDELVEMISEMLVWHGYEECELDTIAAKRVIENYIQLVMK